MNIINNRAYNKNCSDPFEDWNNNNNNKKKKFFYKKLEVKNILISNCIVKIIQTLERKKQV